MTNGYIRTERMCNKTDLPCRPVENNPAKDNIYCQTFKKGGNYVRHL